MDTKTNIQDIVQKYRNNIVHLRVTTVNNDIFRPYLQGSDDIVTGSGILLSVKSGTVLTNAHVAANARHIVAFIEEMGDKMIPIQLISICREKDLAVCLLNTSSIQKLGIPDMVIGDDLHCRIGDAITTLGYPLDQHRIRATTGIIAGFATDMNRFDLTEHTPVYIQITAPINKGDSGGAVFNSKGELIGMSSGGVTEAQSVAYFIGISIHLAIFSLMLPDEGKERVKIVTTPKLGIEYSNSNEDMRLALDSKSEGVFVRRVFPDSCLFSEIREGDFLQRIEFKSPQNKELYATISDDGQLSVSHHAVHTSISSSSITKVGLRSMYLKEFIHLIPVGSVVKVGVIREKEYKILSGKFVPPTIPTVDYIYPQLQPQPYRIYAGLCLCPLTLNHDNDAGRYEPRVVVAQVMEDSSAYSTQSIFPSDIIDNINGVKINFLCDLDKIAISPFIRIRVDSGAIFIISKERKDTQDAEITKKLLS